MRTQFKTVTQNKFNSKWMVSFEHIHGIPGDEYVMMETESAAVFDTEDEAFDAAPRAMNILEKTGRFPNMCEKF